MIQKAQTAEEAAKEYTKENVVSPVFKDEVTDGFIAGASWQASQLSHEALREERDRYLQALHDIWGILESKYESQCEEADWFNNNTPSVGQTIDYRSRPPFPPEMEIINSAIASKALKD